MRGTVPVLLLVACAAPPRGAALGDDEALAADRLRDHLEALQGAADAHGGHRALGSGGYDASVGVVVDHLQALGLAPRTEPFEVTTWEATALGVAWDGGAVARVAAMAWSPAGSATGLPVGVDVQDPPGERPNTSTSGCDAEDFAGFPAGAVAVIQRGTCPYAVKAARAEAAGAVAVIVGNEGQPDRAGAEEGSLDEADPPGIPVVAVSWDDLRALLALDAPVTVTVEGGARVIPSENVLVDVPGRGPGTWVVGAHLDSVPDGPGINDNGTGVAALLQLAEVLARADAAEHGVRLAFWGAEEVGLVGSVRHVQGLDEAERAVILGNLNFDMIGSPNPGRFVYDGSEGVIADEARGASTALQARFEAWFADRGLPTAPVTVGGRSDYVAFASIGVPTSGTFTGAEAPMGHDEAELFGGEAGKPYDACYHRACDALDNVDEAMLEQMARGIAAVVGELREARSPPRQGAGGPLDPERG